MRKDKKHNKYRSNLFRKNYTPTEFGRNIVEKEAYSIFYAMMKLDHLLRDQYFILQTDSKILKPHEY